MLPGYAGRLISESFLERQSGGDVSGAHDQSRLVEIHRRCALIGPASSLRAVFDTAAAPFVRTVGFDSPRDIEALDRAIAATVLAADGNHFTMLAAGCGEPLDSLWRVAVTHALQRRTRWCLLFNGLFVRLIDTRRSYSRRHVEFDLDAVVDDPRTAAAFWFLMRRFPGALHEAVEASDRYAIDVCLALRSGVLAASSHLVDALVTTRQRRAAGSLADTFEQAMTIVYRVLFLLFAEARGLMPLWHPVYRDSYSIQQLCEAVERPRVRTGLWDALRAIARLAHAGCRAGDLHVTAFNGRLFAPARTPLADRLGLDDDSARSALLALARRTAPDGASLERIAYRDLGVEQLGAVYETLLDYQPRWTTDRGPRDAPRVVLTRGPELRKATGTFYTPRPIADYLVRRALAPLVADAASDRILRLRIVDPAMGSGAFLVAACRYLAGAYETALLREGGCQPSDIGEPERASIRRTIAERCLYGVDLNPMAVQLARLSLWLTTLAADRPLTFLDHHLQTGDSLLGAWLSDVRRAQPTGRPRGRNGDPMLDLFGDDATAAALRSALPVRFSLESVPDDTLDHVRSKERALADLNRRDTALSRWKRVANLWCAPWLAADESVPSSVFGAVSDAILGGAGPLPPTTADQYMRAADAAAAHWRLFHWELEFPEVFFQPDGSRLERGGFDVVLGNPPWDMLKADTGEAGSRLGSRASLGPLLRFVHESGAYTAQSHGHSNRYQLFIERAIALTRPGGRLGLVLPSGLTTDHGNAALRRRLLRDCDVDALVGFDNHAAVFPIHRSLRFVLITATAGGPTRSIACRLGERDPASLGELGDEPAGTSPWFPVRLTPGLIERLSGVALAIPDLRSPVDVAIVERAAALFRPLGADDGWAAAFGRELNATDDRARFGRPGEGLPVIEGKHVDPFSVRIANCRYSIGRRALALALGGRLITRPRLAYRDIASPTNRLTLIAAILPAGCASTHTVLCLRTPLPLAAQHFLCGLFNSLVVNYFVRMRVTTHVTTAVVERLPIPTKEECPSAFRAIAALSRGLTRRWNLEHWVRLQTLAAEIYQLSDNELQHVLDSFPLIPKEDRDRVFREFTSRRGGRWDY